MVRLAKFQEAGAARVAQVCELNGLFEYASQVELNPAPMSGPVLTVRLLGPHRSEPDFRLIRLVRIAAA